MDPNSQRVPTTSSPTPSAAVPSGTTTNPTQTAAVSSNGQISSTSQSDKTSTVSGVPLSQIKDAVAVQRQQTPTTTSTNSSPPSRAMEISLVGLQLAAVVVVLFGFIPPILWQNTFLQIFGMLLVGVALFIAIWAVLSFKQKLQILPSPNPSGFLVTGGPYGYIRHPLYLALLVGGVGISLAYPTIPRLLALLLLAYVLYVKMDLEETMLAQRYNGYEKYKKHTGRLLPKWNKPQPAPAKPTEYNEQSKKEI